MWVEVRDRSELCSESVVDLRVVDILVVDVRLDMDELTAIWLLVIGTLAGLLSCLDFRSDPIGESEPVSGAKPYTRTLYFFFQLNLYLWVYKQFL